MNKSGKKKKNYKKKNSSKRKVFQPDKIEISKEKAELIKNKINKQKKELVNKNDELDLPKLKQETKITFFKRKNLIINIIIVVVIVVIILWNIIFIFKLSTNNSVLVKNKVNIEKIEVINYDDINNMIELVITPSNEQEACSLGDESDLSYVNLVDNKCHLTTTIDKHIVYFKNKKNLVSKPLEVNNYVVDFGINETNYLAVDAKMNIANNMIVVGEPKIEIKSDDKILNIDANIITGLNKGETELQYFIDNKLMKEVKFKVTNLIVAMPKEFDNDKDFLTCNIYSKEQADLLDVILESRIKDAGFGTRAGAVAAARFLTLEFPYRISYFWENGRLSKTGTHIVDGEGRYYHKGLYLHESKIDDLQKGAKLTGPAIWGCKIKNYEDDPPNFIRGKKYPNGLDCSGFVSWALLNGGFDVGDIGAGDLPSKGQLTDIADFRILTKELINSKKIKVGDLFNTFGHIAILVGEDENNYYIAESLNDYKGVVLRKYAKNKVNKYFSHVVLMDSLYKQDGNLTDLWY